VNPNAQQLFAANDKLAIHVAGSLKSWAASCRFPHEDVLQEARMGLWHACQRFDPDRGLKFSTYATACVRGHVLTAIARWRGQGRGRTIKRQSEPVGTGQGKAFDRMIADIEGGEADPLESAMRAEVVAVVRVATARMGRRGEVALRRSNEEANREIADSFGCSKQRVSQMMTDALERLARSPQLRAHAEAM
jgi:RNA polymerase sigma factor (sigma-70 family)